jgi:hypothetical protein
MNDPAILLIGGNSEIGNSLVRGISQRKKITSVIKVLRTPKEGRDFNVHVVDSYTDLIFDDVIAKFDVKAIVIAFGLLETSSNLVSDLRHNFEVNVFQYLDVVQKAISFASKRSEVEIHLTSSVLADFSRDTIIGYSLSKEVMEKSIRYLVRNKEIYNSSIYIWKFAFVATPLNKARDKSKIFTKLESIEAFAARTNKPGTYYLPRIARFPSRILRHLPKIAAKLD